MRSYAPGFSHCGASLVGFVYPILLFVAFFSLAATSLVRKSITFDELGHITGGYTSWVTGDHRFFPQNGQFPKRWATWPIQFQELSLPPTDQQAWRDSNVDQFGYQFLYTEGNDLSALLRLSRMMMVVNGLLLGILVYLWSRLLFGVAGANISLTLCVFSPAVLAHSQLVTSDITAALTLTLSLFFIWGILYKITLGRVVGCSGSVGLLCVTKMSALIIGPIIVLLIVLRLLTRRPLLVVLRGRVRVIRSATQQFLLFGGVFATVLMVAWLTIWAFYGFRYSTVLQPTPAEEPVFFGESMDSLTEGSPIGPVIRWARDCRMLPESYLFGLAHVLSHSQAHPAFLNGRYSLSGWNSFLPITLMLKTPIPFFLIAVLAFWAAGDRMRESRKGARWNRFRRSIFRTLPLWVFLAVYWITAVHFHLSIGERHILPTYPALYILCGAAGYWFQRSLAMRSCVVVAVVWTAVEAITIWPHFLAYFNQLAGGPKQGYRHLVDSSLDWGQDLIGLKQWMDTHRSRDKAGTPIYLAYFGTGDPQYYGIEARRLPGYLDFHPQTVPHRLEPGVYCISATMLQSVYNPAFGPWNVQYERLYRDRSALLSNSPETDFTLMSPELTRRWREFDYLRLARLCSHLRSREPDDHVGYSILIYQVSKAELRQALNWD